MSTKPTVLPRWADVGAAITEPTSGKKDIGFVGAERPPAEYLNWLLYYLYLWAEHFSDGDWDGPITVVGDGSDALAITNGDTTTQLLECTYLSCQGPAEFAGPVVIGDIISLGSVISPTTIAADQNDYAPTGHATATVFRLNASGATRTITGLDRGGSGTDGRLIIIMNIDPAGGQDLLLKSQSVLSLVGNRFFTTADITLAPNTSVMFVYDGTYGHWRKVG